MNIPNDNLIFYCLYFILIVVYCSLYILKDEGLWKNVEIFTPKWGEKYTTLCFIYIFIILFSLSFIYIVQLNENPSINKILHALFITILLLYSFTIFCMADGNSSFEEAFFLGTFNLILLLGFFYLLVRTRKQSAIIFSVITLIVYLYVYSWLAEINSNY